MISYALRNMSELKKSENPYKGFPDLLNMETVGVEDTLSPAKYYNLWYPLSLIFMGTDMGTRHII